jgi:hypothetical protein
METPLQEQSTLPATAADGKIGPTQTSIEPRLETDTFCQNCGYNLFGQEVFRDSRLGLLVCQCPQCEQFYPAGIPQTAKSWWSARLAMLCVMAWAAVCIVLMFFAILGMGTAQYTFLDDLTVTHIETPQGRGLYFTYFNGRQGYALIDELTSSTRPTQAQQPKPYIGEVITNRRMRTPADWETIYENPYDHPWEPYKNYFKGNALLYLAVGLFMSLAFWHWRRRAVWALLLPLVMSTIVYLVWKTYPGENAVDSFSIRWLTTWCAYDTLFLALGLLIGRPIARVLVKLILIDRWRKHFEFLWIADNKPMPAPVNDEPPINRAHAD